MSIFSAVDHLQGYLEVVSDRQQLIVSNIANVDTPGYHTKDLNFKQAMQQVMSRDNEAAEPPQPQVLEPANLLERPDGNNVSVDKESLKLSQTQLQFQLGVQLVKGELSTLLSAIKEGA